MVSLDLRLRFYSWLRERRYQRDFPIFLELLDPKKEDVILDVGAGSGVIADRVASTCDEVFVLEPNHERVDYIQRRYPQVKAFFGLAESIPFPESYFTKIYTVSAFHHFKDQDAALSEFDRVLRPKGLLLIHESDPENRGSKIERHFAKVDFKGAGELQNMLENHGFSLKERQNVNHGFLLLSSRQDQN